MRRLGAILFWSVISAAFIGPGTVTTAASAGSGFGFALLWALTFSTVACLALQEAAARLTVVSGHDLGRALRLQYRGGLGGAVVLLLVLGAIVLGCAAYEAGNILGGAAGASIGSGASTRTVTLAIGATAFALLWLGAPGTVARILGVAVAVMGLAFLVTAVRLGPEIGSLLRGAVVPSLPAGSGLLVLGLIGTTVVPYNLFLGSGLAAGQSLGNARFGLAVAIPLGGLISMGIVVAGTAVTGPFELGALADVLGQRLGNGARNLFAVGLFAAGLSSAITAPLAAAITARGLFAKDDDPLWTDGAWRFRLVWGGVLATGVLFGLADVRPVPVIILAQALNGVVLPLVAVFLLLTVNDRRFMGPLQLNGLPGNLCLGAVTAVALVLGASGVVKAACRTSGLPHPGERSLLLGCAAIALLLA